MENTLDLNAPDQESLDAFAFWASELGELEAEFDDYVNDEEFISAA